MQLSRVNLALVALIPLGGLLQCASAPSATLVSKQTIASETSGASDAGGIPINLDGGRRLSISIDGGKKAANPDIPAKCTAVKYGDPHPGCSATCGTAQIALCSDSSTLTVNPARCDCVKRYADIDPGSTAVTGCHAVKFDQNGLEVQRCSIACPSNKHAVCNSPGPVPNPSPVYCACQ
jgi:hypothetical protein